MFTRNNNRNSKFEVAFVSVITLIAILTLGMIKFAPASVANRSYDAIEQVHAARVLAPVSKALNYEGIESLRSNRTFGAASASYEAIESLRTARGLSADRSYDSLEQVRLSQPVTFAAGASSYDMIESLRSARSVTADRSYDAVEQVRASNSVSFPATASSYDVLEQLRLTRGTKDEYAQIEALRLGR